MNRQPPLPGRRTALQEGMVVVAWMEGTTMISAISGLLVVSWAPGIGLVLVLLRMASDQDRAARHAET